MRYLLLLAGGLAMFGCRQDMHDQPRYRLNAASDFWGDRRAARPAIVGTVARGQLKIDTLLHTGKINDLEVDLFPFPVTKETIERGRDRFNIYCTPCHGMTGNGDGMIVSRGAKNPPSYHSDALREAAAGHIFAVISNGTGSMPSYAARIPLQDRWAIVSYVRVLQQSQNIKAAELPSAEQSKIDAPPKKEEGAHR